MTSSTERVRAAYAAIAAAGRSDIWITLLPEDVAVTSAELVDRRVARGETLALAGLVGAVKDNIDIAGVPTTAGCPEYAFTPDRSATCVDRLVAAGLIIIGKTNLDQFATGLVGTRSPYGEVACVSDPSRIAGGSSSGSAVAVGLGLVDLALGTDTAGSGRVPAALNGIVGSKPTRGLVPVSGVVPACPSLDCVSVFATTVGLSTVALGIIAGTDDRDPLGRTWPSDAPLGAPPAPVVGVPGAHFLDELDASSSAAFADGIARLAELGATVREVDIAPLLEAGALLYGGAFVAERYASVGAFVDAHLDRVDPVVGPIISGGGRVPAWRLVEDRLTISLARSHAASLFTGIDVLMLPTVTEHPTFEEVHADPVGVNARLGRLTTFANLLDLAAIALPLPDRSGRAGSGGSTFGITLFAPAFGDQVIADLAAAFLGEARPPSVATAEGSSIVVVGAHLSGEPLNHQLTSLGGRLLTSTTTSSAYRLFALSTTPPKPGLIRDDSGTGAPIAVEVWVLPPAHFADFVAQIPPPLAIGRVELSDSRELPGFVLAATAAPPDAPEITSFGGWRAYRATLPR